jgi:hypothetical protein
MSREPGVSYEWVSQACYELLGKGERPSRSQVQDLLSKHHGFKGSNQVVEAISHIKQFWTSMKKTLELRQRSVDGVPDEYVSILDKALTKYPQQHRRWSPLGPGDHFYFLVVFLSQLVWKYRWARGSGSDFKYSPFTT